MHGEINFLSLSLKTTNLSFFCFCTFLELQTMQTLCARSTRDGEITDEGRSAELAVIKDHILQT